MPSSSSNNITKPPTILPAGRRSAAPAVATGSSSSSDESTTIMAAAAAAVACRSLLHLFLVVLAVSVSGVCWSTKSFTITNNCGYTVWPGILSGAGSPALDTTGFELPLGASRTLPAPAGWSGRLWGRTLCSTDAATNKFACATGDCGSGDVACGGGNGAPPATLAEFTLDGSDGKDFYDVSLVDGYNLPILVVPSGAAPGTAGTKCAATGCLVDLNGACPGDLRVVVTPSASAAGAAVACKSACLAFGSPEYCCSGEYGRPDTCRPSAYSEFFKNACPRAITYAYDDATSTFTCAGGDTAYTITNSDAKSSGPNSQPPPPPPPAAAAAAAAGDKPHVDVTVGSQFPAWGVVAGALSVLAAVLGAIFGCVKYMMKRRAQDAPSNT